MNSATAFKPVTEARPRRVTHRTRGRSHGAITRLVSPSDVGELIKPFVFLDYFDIDPKHVPPIGFHPHSGIATLTLLHEGRIFYEETSGTKGIIEPAQMPAAIQALADAVAADDAARAASKDSPEGQDNAGSPRDPISLRQRAWPLVEMLKRAHAADEPVTWGV